VEHTLGEQLPLPGVEGEAHFGKPTDCESQARNHGETRASFAARIIAWQRRQGRQDLPWQNTRDPYRIWLSEIMLQQTQVAAVIPYYVRFLQRFPDVFALANAEVDDVLALWSGLGYYARGRNLHRAARQIRDRHVGVFPDALDGVVKLPGIGPSTAAAICVFAYGARHPILDGNVKRVLARHQGIAGYPGEAAVQARLWERAWELLPDRDLEPYTQGLMDLGAGDCSRTRPRCAACPVHVDCIAYQEHRTQELPAPRPRKVLPQRETRFVVMLDEDRVLLEKRPAPGIWGAMWCFPEAAEDTVQVRAAAFALDVGEMIRLPPIEHGFTHYRLRIYPVLVRVKRSRAVLHEPRTMWVNAQSALSYAIPTPVRRLLELLARLDQ
jgi:A/G-specific adenine glycosylase